MTFIKKVFVFLLIFSLKNVLLFAEPVTMTPPPAQGEKEELFLRRMIDLWEEKQYDIVKVEIAKFLTQFKEGAFVDYLHVLLGDIYIEEKKYGEAFAEYKGISDPELKEKTFCNFLQCLYEIKNYALLTSECQKFLEEKKSLDKERAPILFFLAQSYYHQGIDAKLEDQKKFFLLAKSCFEELRTSSFEKASCQALAKMAQLSEDVSTAASLYLDLANKNPQEREDFLFQAALCFSECDQEKAIDLFGEIFHAGKTKSWEAGYNRLLLLFEKGLYSEVILAKDQLYGYVPEEKVPFLHFVVGKSYFQLEDYKRSAEELKKYISCEDKKAKEIEGALSLLLSIANVSEDSDLFTDVIHQLESFKPQSAQLPKAIFASALLKKKKSQLSFALEDFQKLNNYKDFEEKGASLFEYGHLLYQMKRWRQSREQFKTFVEAYKDHPLFSLGWNYLMHASMESSLEISDEQMKSKKCFLQDVETFLDNKYFSSEEEKEEWLFLLAQTKFDLQDDEGVKSLLCPLLEKKMMQKHLAEECMLIALAYKNQKNMQCFCEYAKKALEADKSGRLQHSFIHLALFNAYLNLSKTEKSALADAAEHLYQVQKKTNNILSNNLLWLCDYYYDQVICFFKKQWDGKLEQDKEAFLAANRSVEMLEKVISENAKDFVLEEKNKFLEAYVLKLAEMYGKVGKQEDQVAILEKLVAQYKQASSLRWEFKEKAFFDLATSYEKRKEDRKALQYFTELLSFGKNSYFSGFALLHGTRLRLLGMDREKCSLENPEVFQEMERLKNLKIQKKLETEPVHLEAALDYVDLQSMLERNQSKKLEMLLKVKQDFSSEEDILSKDYHKSRELLHEKDRLFQAYMKMIEGEICLYRAMNASSLAQRVEWKKKSLDILISLEKEKGLLNDFMKNRWDGLVQILEKLN